MKIKDTKARYKMGAVLIIALLMLTVYDVSSDFERGTDASGQMWDRGSIDKIRASNGKVWNVTDDDLQLAINSLNNASGTVYLGGNVTVDCVIHLWNNTRLDLCGYTIIVAPSFTSGNTQGVFEIGDTNGLIYNVTICNGNIIGGYYSSYPTASGNNLNILGIHSNSTLINCSIHHMRFENLFGAVILEKLGCRSNIPSKNIRMEHIDLKDLLAGVQTYANGYEYEEVIIENVFAENVEDDVVAIVGHWGGIAGATPIVRNVIVNNIQVFDKNTNIGGAVVKLDAGDAAAGQGIMSNIIVNNINANNSNTNTGANIAVIILSKGQNTEKLYFSNIIGYGEWTYGIWLAGKMENYYIDNIILNAEYGIFLQCSNVPYEGQTVLIDGGYLAPRTINETNDQVAGKGIVLAAGVGTQGIRNLRVKNIDTMWLEYPIYEGASPPTGVQGTYCNNSYNLDIGNRQFAHLSLSSDPVDLNIYRSGTPMHGFHTFNSTYAEAGYRWINLSTNVLSMYNGTAWVSTTFT